MLHLEFPFKGAFFDPRYRPPTPVLVDSEVRGTTPQKLIVVSEVRAVDMPDSMTVTSLESYPLFQIIPM